MSIKTLFAASVLAASHVVNAAVLPIRQTATDGLTCADKAVGATFSTKLASNSQFDITCGADYYGNDLNNGLRWPGSFQGCLDTCDAEPLCSTVAYVDGACYLKQGVPTLQTGNDAVWSAKKTPPPTCDGSSNSDGTIYSTSAGSFQIICGKDYGGNDLGGVNTGSFSACIDLCATTNNCVDVSFQYGSCYPKFALGDLTDNGSVWTAKFLGTRASTSSSAASSAIDSASATASPTSTSNPVVPQALSCIDSKDDGISYTAQTGGDFTVECAMDYWGADIGAVSGVTTFEECMDNCDANTDCVDVSWVWGSCYMKDAVNTPGQSVDHVWTGRRTLARAAVVSSSAVSSSTSLTTPSATVESSSSDQASVTPTSTSSPSADSSVASVTPTSTTTPSPSVGSVPQLSDD